MPKKKKSAPKKQVKVYDSEDSRTRLREAAIKLFSKEGYDGASTRAIASLAGVNEALIQRYFNGKLGLFFSIIEEFHRNSTNKPLSPKTNSLKKEIKNIFQAKLDHAKETKSFFKIVMSKAIVDPTFRKEISSYANANHPELFGRLKQLQEDGLLRKDLKYEEIGRVLMSVVMSWIVFLEVMESLDKASFAPIFEVAVQVLADGMKPQK